MKPKDLAALLILSALWGGSFLFIRVAAPVLGPIMLIAVRVFIAGSALFIYAMATGLDLEIRKRWKQYLLVGLLNSAIPFTLIATAELNLTAGIAAILNATTPIFGAIVAAIWLKEILSTRKIIGMVLGITGVSVLVGWSEISFTLVVVLSILASLVGATFYGVAGVYTKIATKGVNPIVLATCSQLAASLFLIPLTPFAFPSSLPGWDVVLSVLALSLVSTAIAYVIFFRLIANVGPTKAMTVTFLAPVFGVLWGVLLLNEPLTISTLVGFAIILSGTGLVTGISFKKAEPVPALPKTSA